eukprot:sb/3467994/
MPFYKRHPGECLRHSPGGENLLHHPLYFSEMTTLSYHSSMKLFKKTVFDPDIPGTTIYRTKPFTPSIPVNRGPTAHLTPPLRLRKSGSKLTLNITNSLNTWLQAPTRANGTVGPLRASKNAILAKTDKILRFGGLKKSFGLAPAEDVTKGTVVYRKGVAFDFWVQSNIRELKEELVNRYNLLKCEWTESELDKFVGESRCDQDDQRWVEKALGANKGHWEFRSFTRGPILAFGDTKDAERLREKRHDVKMTSNFENFCKLVSYNPGYILITFDHFY